MLVKNMLPALVVEPFHMPRPVDWAEVFGREATVELEIGFGRGDFLVQRASERPNVNLIGLEVSSLSVLKAWRRISRAGIPNVRLAKAEARSGLFYFFAERSLSRSWVLFPEPWPKARHEARRLLSADFLRLLASRTIDRGELFVATDCPAQRDWVISESERSGAFALETVDWPVPMTKYHEKWQKEGRDIYPLLLRKKDHPDVSGFFPNEVEMSQIKLRDFREPALAVKDFVPLEEQQGEIFMRVMKAYLSQDAEEALFLCLTSEDGFIQRFAVSAKRVGDVVLIKPQDHAHLVITPGVKRCVERVAGLVGLKP